MGSVCVCRVLRIRKDAAGFSRGAGSCLGSARRMAAAFQPLRAGRKLLKKILSAIFLALAVAFAIWFFVKGSDVPQVPFAKTTRVTISNVLSTNGKVEPADYVDVRVESPGLVKRVL